MQQKQEAKQLEGETLRYRMLPLFATNVAIHKIPLCAIQIVFQVLMFLQMLRYPIDYFSSYWLGYSQGIFSFLDLSYYQKSMSVNGFQSVLILVICLITVYWMGTLALYLIKFKYGQSAANVRRLLLIAFSTVLFMPIQNTILNLFNCDQPTFFRPCMIQKNPLLIGLSISTFIIFTLTIIAQSLLRFEFIEDEKVFKRIKSSSFVSVGMIIYVLVNEITFYYMDETVKLIVLDISIVLMLAVFFLKDEHFQEWTKLLELNMLLINFIPIAMINAMYFLKIQLNFSFLLILWPIAIISVQKLNLHTLEFELQNVNKWNTPAMMIRYAETLRKLLKRNDEYLYQTLLHGYIEFHRQKCDNPTCPYNVENINSEEELLKGDNLSKKPDEVLRTEGIIKKIFNDGCKIAPINPELELEYAHFLFEIDQKESSLKHLLLIKYQDLSFDKYFKYVTLKQKIHNQMCQKPQRQFLDLVSELQVKRKEQEIIQKLEQAALINLQFWSVLNEDHPDFQKLNETGSTRVKIGQQVRERYEDICRYAHSQKVTNLYVHFLTSIENNEEMYNKLYDEIKKKFRLDEKIMLQDWSNSSLSTLLVSIQSANYGTMIDLNSTCASMFGYEKYEIINRHFKTMFCEQMRDQIRQFLNPKIKEQTFFMSHKNSYLLKICRKVQTYNSMETGMTSICTLNNMISLNSCFIVFNKNEKVIGLSSSCISLLGIDYKMVQQSFYLKDILTFSLEEVKKASANGNQTFRLIEICKLLVETAGGDYRKEPYMLTCAIFSNGTFCIEFTISRTKMIQKHATIPVRKFEFQIQTSLEDFKYIGFSQSDNVPYLSQFSQLHFAESIKNSQPIDLNYGGEITTLRLKDNIIQVIEENDDETSELHIKRESEALREEIENLSRKDEEEIFASKEAFQKFISNYKITKSIRLILLVGVILAIGAYIGFYFIFKGHNHVTTDYFSQLAYENMIIGTIARQNTFITSLELMKAGVSKRQASTFYRLSNHNLNFLQKIKLLGSAPYPLTTYISADSPRQFYSDEFLLSYINYAVNLVSAMKDKNTQQQLVTAYNGIEKFKIDYLKINGNVTRELMYQKIKQRQTDILSQIAVSMYTEVIMLVVAVSSLVALGAVLGCIISKINQEKINTLQTFLSITEQQIQKFSSKTEKFLISLHVQDTTGEIDLDDQNDHKKINSSTFAKKKRFKLVKLNKSIYVKVLIIPLLAQAFFILSFLTSYTSLQFMYDSIPYIALTSQADNTFYTGLTTVQATVLNQGTNQTGLSNSYLSYYRKYFDVHYDTFGQIPSFHRAFTSVFMENICDGDIQIDDACTLTLLAKNGTLLIFTDITVKTQKSNFVEDFTNDYYIGYSVISAAHKYLTMLAIDQQKKLIVNFENSLLNYLIIWIFVMMGVSLIYGLFVLNNFIKEVNQNKNMLMLMPISIAKNLTGVKKYINSILNSTRLC